MKDNSQLEKIDGKLPLYALKNIADSMNTKIRGTSAWTACLTGIGTFEQSNLKTWCGVELMTPFLHWCHDIPLRIWCLWNSMAPCFEMVHLCPALFTRKNIEH